MVHREVVFILLALVSLCLADLAVAQSSATDAVKKVVDEVVSIVSNQEVKKAENKEKRQKELKDAIGTIFDFPEMARRSLGAYWDDRTSAEKSEFAQVFETLLQNTYSKKIESYSNEKIVYLKETVEGDTSQVKSMVVTSQRNEISIEYRLMNKGGKWMIYDVVIEGVNLVTNYHTQFEKIIRSEGYPELVKKLKSKNAETSTQ
jgi:phospholipid transport system substrate-binding protein